MKKIIIKDVADTFIAMTQNFGPALLITIKASRVDKRNYLGGLFIQEIVLEL